MSYRILICYHTASGNTGWVTGQIARQLGEFGADVFMQNIACQQDAPAVDTFDAVGFGCPVMGFRPTFAMTDVIEKLPVQHGKPAFIFVSYAAVCASSLWMLAAMLSRKGYRVIAAERFRGELSWPVARLTGIIASKGRPDERDLSKITTFSRNIYAGLKSHREQGSGTFRRVPFAFFNPLSYMALLNKAAYLRFIMGKKRVDQSRCTRCGLCQKQCAASAISLNPYPQFNESCIGCWGCYNICPEKAISTFLGPRWGYAARAHYLDASPAHEQKP